MHAKVLMIRNAVLAMVIAAVSGCGNRAASRSEDVDGQQIMPQRGRLPTEPYTPVDQPGQLPYHNARTLREGDGTAPRTTLRPSPTVAQALERAVPPLAEPFDQAATTLPTTASAGSTGTYQTIGGVVAEVNNTPIYADKVVSDLEPVLAAGARQLSPQKFKAFAEAKLADKVRDNINRELEFAAAERQLGQREKDEARLMVERWRQQEITNAGGSIEAARRRWAELGRDFEEQAKEQYRRFMSIIYLRKQILPHVQPNAAEMREYYDRNRDQEFTVRDAAQFEMIQIDPEKVGGRDVAQQKIQDLRARAARGEDFAELAKFSNRPPLRNSQGVLPWHDRGAFALGAVEEAVWKLQPGQVSDVIEEGGKFYIVKLEQKRVGRVVPFEEEATQDAIFKRLQEEQLGRMREKLLQDLRQQSIVRTDAQMMQSALEIAMQRYAQWAGK